MRPRLREVDAVFCTGSGMVHPYAITLVGLRYEPEQWLREAPLALTTGPWDVYVGYGKVHFLLGDLGFAALSRIKENGRDDRVLFIVRPGALGFTRPVREIADPRGRTTLWICEGTL